MAKNKEYNALREQFENPDSRYKLAVYFDAKQTDASDDAANFVRSCESRDIGWVIPRISEDRRLDPGELEHFRRAYAKMLAVARERNLNVMFNIEGAIEDWILSRESARGENTMRSKILNRREFACSPDEDTKIKLPTGGVLMSVVAVNEYNGEIIDLRKFVTDENTLVWHCPQGSWIVNAYVCADDMSRNYANVLNYKSSMMLLETAYGLFEDIFKGYTSKELDVLAYSNLCFNTQNRRDWDPDFNRVFEKNYGFDPAPYYPMLFATTDAAAPHIKALMFDCRARMMRDGMVKALHDFAAKKKMSVLGSLAEPKLSACSFVNGDAMLNTQFAPGALYDRAYMYGTNSVKIAAGTAYNFGNDNVTCELFRDYYKISKRIMYNDMLNAYARGANIMVAHMPKIEQETKGAPVPFVKSETAPSWQGEFAFFTSRTQALLRGGDHIADIALLYPIYHIHSKVTLYEDKNAEAFEYPSTPDNLDYMTVINSISTYAGHDLTVIHPDSMNDKVNVEGGKLILDNGKNKETFSVLVLPATPIISLNSARKILHFFNQGGKIIATGELPKMAFEYNGNKKADREVREIMDMVFGHDASDPNIMKSFCYNKNENGGEAYFLYFSRTAADGTNMVSSRQLSEALASFDIPYDIYLPGMPRFEATGALNNAYKEFVRLGLNTAIPGGGMLNHIHKKRGSTDIYYFSNTTEKDYEHTALLRGVLSPEIWDPHTVTFSPAEYSYVKHNGEIYTEIKLNLPHSKSLFIISDTEVNKPEIPSYIPVLN